MLSYELLQWGYRKMGILYVLFISIPEEALLLILTLLFLGKREYLDLKIKSNAIKMLVAIVLTTLFSVLLHNYIEKYGFMLFVRILFFVIVYCLVYKANFYKVLKGFIMALLIFILGEFFGSKIIELIAGINQQILEKQYIGSITYILLTIPRRVLQIIAVVVLYKKEKNKRPSSQSIS